MARIVRPSWAIRCLNSSCKELFEVVPLEAGKQQEVVCPKCGEHYLYPPLSEDEKESFGLRNPILHGRNVVKYIS